jgi:hypothetical protein
MNSTLFLFLYQFFLNTLYIQKLKMKVNFFSIIKDKASFL